MKNVVLIFFLSFGTIIYAQTNYYVTTTGDDSNTGLSENEAWKTITYAASANSPVSEGDTVYVKAGNYGAEHIVFEFSQGSLSQTITFEGYQTTPGDNPDLDYSFGDILNPSVMPLLNGGDRTTAGIAITLYNQNHILLKNFQITNYQHGIDAWKASYSTIENIILISLGDYNASYNGTGINISPDANGNGGEGNTLKDCVVANACAEGISLIGNNNIIDHCEIYCDEDFTNNASMDYYIFVAGNDNYITDCYIERFGDLIHGGHGIGLKGNAENNLFENCIAKNLEGASFYVRHRGVMYNEFRNCKAIGTLDDVLAFLVRDGASYNEFNNCVSEGCSSGIRFLDTTEDGGAQYCGRYNRFNNCIIKNPDRGIDFHYYSVPSPADHNYFVNCLFYNGNYLFKATRENYDNEMINCIVYGFQTLKTGTEPLLFDYAFCDFYNNGFSTLGIGNISGNPLFLDENNEDFHLQTNSPCIDAGTSTGAPLEDFEGTLRPQGSGFDIGAYEFLNNLAVNSSSVEDNCIYPNPTFNKTIIKGDNLNLNEIKIFNILGQEVTKSTSIEYINENTLILNLKKLKEGIYLVKTKSNTYQVFKK